MFTGIVEEIGELREIRPRSGGIRMTVGSRIVTRELSQGDSVNVDGVCQTVVSHGEDSFTVEAVGETLEKTGFTDYRRGRRVNLERAARPDTFLGGHIVQGHVNGLGTVVSTVSRGEGFLLVVELPDDLLRYTVAEGSIAIDGVSLTVAAVTERSVSINVVPHTAAHTTLGDRTGGDRVHVEVDILAKYVERLLERRHGAGPSFQTLREWGY